MCVSVLCVSLRVSVHVLCMCALCTYGSHSTMQGVVYSCFPLCSHGIVFVIGLELAIWAKLASQPGNHTHRHTETHRDIHNTYTQMRTQTDTHTHTLRGFWIHLHLAGVGLQPCSATRGFLCRCWGIQIQAIKFVEQEYLPTGTSPVPKQPF